MQFFGKMVRGVRDFRKLSPAQVGLAVGVSASTILAIEKGQMPQMANFLRLCRWIGIKPSVFLDDEDVPSPAEASASDHHPVDEADAVEDEFPSITRARDAMTAVN